MSFVPPSDGSVFLFEAVDKHLEQNPDSSVYVFSRDEGELESINWLEFARACHRMAHQFRPPGTGRDGEVVGILAKGDVVVYHALTLGMMKAGLKPFPISPTNSPMGVLNLLKQVDCHRLVATQDCLLSLIEGLRSEISKTSPTFDLEILDFPSVDDTYPRLARESVNDPFEPYRPSFPRPSPTDIAMYLHSSGSTGLPKAIPFSHQVLVAWGNIRKLSASFLSQLKESPTPVSTGKTNEGVYPAFTAPAFGIWGFSFQVLRPVFVGLPVFTFPPTRSCTSPTLALTADNVLKYLRLYHTDQVMVFPAFLHHWSEDEAAIQFLRTLKHVGYGGGPILPSVGKKLCDAGVNLMMSYGTTEVGIVSLFRPGKAERADWEYMELNDVVKIRWMHTADGIYQAHILETELHPLPVINTPEMTGYALPDLFAKHPTKEGLWRITGRKDDVFVGATGSNVVPGPVEAIVNDCRLVKHAIMFGQSRMQTGILIEPADSVLLEAMFDSDDLVAEIWPSIEKANAITQRYARIDKNMILFTVPNKPLPLNIKGLVRRKDAIALYSSEIDALYAQRCAGHAPCEIASTS